MHHSEVFELTHLYLENGNCPYEVWFDGLDKTDRQIVVSRLIRVRRGSFGKINPVGGGVWELKFRKGPGFRIYYALIGKQVILLIAGGDKGTQSRDIHYAKELFNLYKKGRRENETR